ncbi:MAG TPA: hypothetical protein VFZ28_14490 [Burkholderiaceae bacterium]|nr:hypothetical protein [Burkholderiaceae bacterium]
MRTLTDSRFGAVVSRRPRLGRVMLCLAAVVVAHVALWFALSRPPPASEPVGKPAVQVRRLVVPQAHALEPTNAPRAARTPQAAVRHVQPRPPARLPSASEELPAPDGLAARDAEVPPAATALPVYPTRIPPSARLTYALQRGAATGLAVLDWEVDGDGYRLQLQSTMSQGRPVDRHSQGGFDAAGLAPLRLADRQRGRDVRAANFQRERGVISFSGPRWEWPLYGGAQDRLSWLVQLVAIAAAAPDALHEGAALSMWVVGTRGAVGAWRFEVRGREPAGGGEAWALVREPAHPYDLRIELWLDPARGYWPVRLRQTQVPGGEPLEWLLRDEPQRPAGT